MEFILVQMGAVIGLIEFILVQMNTRYNLSTDCFRAWLNCDVTAL